MNYDFILIVAVLVFALGLMLNFRHKSSSFFAKYPALSKVLLLISLLALGIFAVSPFCFI